MGNSNSLSRVWSEIQLEKPEALRQPRRRKTKFCSRLDRNTPGWIRTSNLRFRRPMLYPVELQVLTDGKVYSQTRFRSSPTKANEIIGDCSSHMGRRDGLARFGATGIISAHAKQQTAGQLRLINSRQGGDNGVALGVVGEA